MRSNVRNSNAHTRGVKNIVCTTPPRVIRNDFHFKPHLHSRTNIFMHTHRIIYIYVQSLNVYIYEYICLYVYAYINM